MKLDDLFKNPDGWLKGIGPEADIVISSRIRMARNLKEFSFSDWADAKEKEKVVEKVKKAIENSNYLKGSLFLRIDELPELDKQVLLERQLISLELANKKGPAAVCISDKEIFSIMINEEDHLRLQVIQSGFDFAGNWRIIEKIDDELSAQLDVAYSPKLGFLTACPTNAGTGMRASAMMHLPALVMNKAINKILNAIAKLSFNVRGFHGEGTEASGNFFQISNQITLGRSELTIIDDIEGIVKQVIEHEKNVRKKMLREKLPELEDKIYRAYGTLKNARVISSEETMNLLSILRLGVDSGIIKDINRSFINELLVITQPAHLQKMEGKILSAKQRNLKRAEIIRGKIK
ncbi:MAG: protein arginine kinase [Candidatus Omnitrophota bacterium]